MAQARSRPYDGGPRDGFRPEPVAHLVERRIEITAPAQRFRSSSDAKARGIKVQVLACRAKRQGLEALLRIAPCRALVHRRPPNSQSCTSTFAYSPARLKGADASIPSTAARSLSSMSVASPTHSRPSSERSGPRAIMRSR
jgi:hypothetical protein